METDMSNMKVGFETDSIKLDRFDGTNYTRWQDRMSWLLLSLKLFHLLDANLQPVAEPNPDDSEAVKNKLAEDKTKRETDEMLCRGYILNSAPTKSVRCIARNESDHNSAPDKPVRNTAPSKQARCLASNESGRNSAPTKSVRDNAATDSEKSTKFVRNNAATESEKSARTSAQDGAPVPQPLNANSHIQIGRKVLLKCLVGNDIVAKGFIESLDESKVVGKEELGPDWCEVRVTVAIKPEQRLLRTNGNIKMMGKATGSSIAWPRHLVQGERGS